MDYGMMQSAGSIGESKASMLRVLGGLNLPFDYERSFKISDRQLFSNRFLLSSCKRDYGALADRRIIHVCRELGMPAEHLHTIGFHLSNVENIHFGFEQDTDGCMFKVYLEFAKTIALIHKADGRHEPELLYLAYKWCGAPDKKGVVTRYVWYPVNSMPQILSMISEVYEGEVAGERLKIAEELLELVAANMPVEDIQYLEVREDMTGRKSFDLNFYDAGLMVNDIHPLLVRMCKDYKVGLGRFQGLYDQIKGMRVGHLASGKHRGGAGFSSIYYGACEGSGFTQALQDARGTV